MHRSRTKLVPVHAFYINDIAEQNSVSVDMLNLIGTEYIFIFLKRANGRNHDSGNIEKEISQA